MLNNKQFTQPLGSQELIDLITHSYNLRAELHHPSNLELKTQLAAIISNIITQLEQGEFRAAQPLDLNNSVWTTNVWIKQAILLSFMLNHSQIMDQQGFYIDKLPAMINQSNVAQYRSLGVRVLPYAYIRAGVYLGKNTIVMPSFINIGAFIDEGTMIDSCATIGSCAQIGKNVHIGAGVTIGGVLEPIQDDPTIIEDHCFIGANSAVVEGVIVERNSVIGSGVILSKTTKIYDRDRDTISYGRIPSGSVVVGGSLNINSKYNVNCAIIVKRIDQQTLSKTEINQILRAIDPIS